MAEPRRISERARLETTYGAPLPPSYAEDDAYREAVERLGLPGEPPYTRGVQPTMYRGRLWTMRQYAGFGTAEETNARFRYLLEHGQTGLSVAFDLPTQMGYDADDAQVAGEVGKVGVSISSLDDLEQLFAGIPLDKVTTSMTINATAAILLAMYAAVAKKQGVPLAEHRRDDAERHPEGVHRARHVHLPAAALAATRHGPHRVLRRGAAAVESDLDQRLSHPRGRARTRCRSSRSRSPTRSSTSRAR